MVKKERLEYLDLVKGFSIILIVLGHIYRRGGLVSKYIYSFHVPIFFIVTGMLLKYKNENNIKKVIINRFKGIMIPYFIFDFFNIIVYLCLNGFTYQNICWNIIDTIILFGRGATWFLPCLFIAEVSFIIIRNVFKNDKVHIMCCLVCFFIPIFITAPNAIIFVLFRSMIAIGFICFGYYIFEKQYYKNYIFIILIILFIVLPKNSDAELYALKFGNVFLYIVNAIVGSLMLITIFKKLKTNKVLKNIGTNSLIIMGTHQNILNIIFYILNSRFEGYIEGTILLFVVFIIEFPIIYIINNYLPFIIGKKRIKSNC